jgi:hypothetical protein
MISNPGLSVRTMNIDICRCRLAGGSNSEDECGGGEQGVRRELLLTLENPNAVDEVVHITSSVGSDPSCGSVLEKQETILAAPWR